MSKPASYVALLRGINVGGNNNVSMAALKVTFEELGYANVRTYINSGNVLFESTASDARALERKLEGALATHFSAPIKVMVRTAAEMQATLAHIPKSWHDPTNKRCNVIFLRHNIDHADIVKNLNPKPDIEELHYAPGVLFWSANIDTLTRSNMIKLSGQRIYQDMTIRNLNTLRKLCELLQK